MYPQTLHLWEVYLGETAIQGTPTSLLLYSTNRRSWKKLQEFSVLRNGLETVMLLVGVVVAFGVASGLSFGLRPNLSLIPERSSSAIPPQSVFSLLHQLLGDAMIHILSKPSLFLTSLLQKALGTLSAFLLELLA